MADGQWDSGDPTSAEVPDGGAGDLGYNDAGQFEPELERDEFGVEDPQAELAQEQLLERRAVEMLEEYPELADETTVEQLIERGYTVAQELGVAEDAVDLEFLRAVHVSSGAAADHERKRTEVDRMFGPETLGRRALPFG